MKVKRFTCGPIVANGYVIYQADGGECMIIDPGYEPQGYIDFVKEHQLRVTRILLTHLHYDHTDEAEHVQQALGGEICMHEADAAVYKGRVDVILHDGDIVELDGEKIQVLSTPGHTKGSVCFYAKQSGICFTGDTLFDTDLGRTDLAGGSSEDMIRSIQNVCSTWPDGVIIYPGHDRSENMKFVRKYNLEYNACMMRPRGIAEEKGNRSCRKKG